jgi:hypothetical protein
VGKLLADSPKACVIAKKQDWQLSLLAVRPLIE